MNKLRSKKSVMFLSLFLFLFSISLFAYTNVMANEQEPCEVCSGTEGDEQCVYVNIGANDHCVDSSMGSCSSWGSAFCP